MAASIPAIKADSTAQGNHELESNWFAYGCAKGVGNCALKRSLKSVKLPVSWRAHLLIISCDGADQAYIVALGIEHTVVRNEGACEYQLGD